MIPSRPSFRRKKRTLKQGHRGGLAAARLMPFGGLEEGGALEDPYLTLGVPRDATPEDLRHAYHKLAKQHHPDLNPGNAAAEERFKAVASAHALLSDPLQRGRFDRGEINSAGQDLPPRSSYRAYADSASGRRYSRSGATPEGAGEPGEPGGPGGWRAEDFSAMFGAMFDQERQPSGASPWPGPDELYSLTIDFLEAVNGVTRRLTLPDGRTLEVKIPPGTAEGQVLRLRRQGRPSRAGGSQGDALIEVHVSAHRWFRREGQDLRLEVPVSVAEAVLGAQVEVPTPGGPVHLRIPPHSDSGTELRLRGRGVPAAQGRAAGDLRVTLRLVLGPPDAALEEFLRTWQPDPAFDPRHAMEGQHDQP